MRVYCSRSCGLSALCLPRRAAHAKATRTARNAKSLIPVRCALGEW